MSYDVCYIDDHLLPFGAEIANEHSLISKTEIENSLTKPNWDEPTVQRFLSNTLKKGKKFNQLELSGFLNPDFFLNYIAESDYKPNTIVLDWDFTTSKAEQKINEIIQQTDSKIFVLTGNDLKPEVEAVLKPFKDAHQNRIFDVYKKTSGIHQFEKATQENLLEEIIADLTTIEEVYEYAGTEISFYPSFILPNFDWFWMLESILGSNFIKEYIVENSLLISQATIEKMFDDSEVKFYINNENSRIYSANGSELHKFYGDELRGDPISPLYAINNYDLAILETACEKGTSKIFNSDEG